MAVRRARAGMLDHVPRACVLDVDCGCGLWMWIVDVRCHSDVRFVVCADRPREIYPVQNPKLPTQLPNLNLRIPTDMNHTYLIIPASVLLTNLEQRFEVKLGLKVGKFSQKLGKKIARHRPDPLRA